MAGEVIALDPNDQNSAARALNRPPGSGSGPTQRIGGRPGQVSPATREPQQNAAPAPSHLTKLALALWHGPGWYQETIDMLDGFFQHDGQQDRACYILSNPIHPVPIEVMQAAQRAFTYVRVYDTMFADPATGIITPYALYDFAGIVPQKLGHRARIFYTMPLRVVGPNSLARLEQQAYQANQGRDKATGKLIGKGILGAVRETKQGKFPFSSFVALPTWVMESEFPLVRGLSKQPAKTAQDSPMTFLRYELMKHMAVSELINAEPWKAPSDPRFVLLEGVQLTPDRFPNMPLHSSGGVAQLPDVEEDFDPAFAPSSAPEASPAPAEPVVVGTGLVARAAIPEFMPRPPDAPAVARFTALPPLEEVADRISREGLAWLKSYDFPTDLKAIKVIHNAEVARRKAVQEAEDLPDTPEPAPAPRAPFDEQAADLAAKHRAKAPAKKPTKPKKAALTVQPA